MLVVNKRIYMKTLFREYRCIISGFIVIMEKNMEATI